MVQHSKSQVGTYDFHDVENVQEIAAFTKQNGIQYKTWNLMEFAPLDEFLGYFGHACPKYLLLPGYTHVGWALSLHTEEVSHDKEARWHINVLQIK